MRIDMAEGRLAELERKVELVMRGLNILLFEEGEEVSEEEAQELRARLQEYLAGKSSEFVELSELNTKDTDPQEGSEGDPQPPYKG